MLVPYWAPTAYINHNDDIVAHSNTLNAGITIEDNFNETAVEFKSMKRPTQSSKMTESTG